MRLRPRELVWTLSAVQNTGLITKPVICIGCEPLCLSTHSSLRWIGLPFWRSRMSLRS